MELTLENVSLNGSSNLMPETCPRMAPLRKISNWFDQFDLGGSGTMSKSQFLKLVQSRNPESSFPSADIDAIWKKLDRNGTGRISRSHFTDAMTSTIGQLRERSNRATQRLSQHASLVEA